GNNRRGCCVGRLSTVARPWPPPASSLGFGAFLGNAKPAMGGSEFKRHFRGSCDERPHRTGGGGHRVCLSSPPNSSDGTIGASQAEFAGVWPNYRAVTRPTANLSRTARGGTP